MYKGWQIWFAGEYWYASKNGRNLGPDSYDGIIAQINRAEG
jgi:hypothetical protein